MKWQESARRRCRCGLRRVAGWLFCLSIVTAADAEEPMRVTVLGGAAQGTMMALSQAVGEALRREFPGTAYTYEPGSMGGALYRVLRGETAFAMCGSIELRTAAIGEPPYAGGNLSEPAVVARISAPLFGYFIARRDFLERYQVTRLADIAARRLPVRISIGQPGNLTVSGMSTAFLAVVGYGESQITAHGGIVYKLPKRASFDLMKDGRNDITFTGSYFPDAMVTELARSESVQFIDPGEEVVRQVADRLAAQPATIPAGVYDFVDRDVPAPAIHIYLVAAADAPDRDVLMMVQALHRQFDALRGLHPAFLDLVPQTLAMAGGFTRHPAARRYFDANGLGDRPAKEAAAGSGQERAHGSGGVSPMPR